MVMASSDVRHLRRHAGAAAGTGPTFLWAPRTMMTAFRSRHGPREAGAPGPLPPGAPERSITGFDAGDGSHNSGVSTLRRAVMVANPLQLRRVDACAEDGVAAARASCVLQAD